MLRVLQLGPLPPPWGGVQTNLDGIREFLLRQGHQPLGLNITRHRRANTATEFFPHSSPEVLRLLATLPYDIVHLHLGGEISPRLVALCLAVTSVPGKRSVLSFHSGGYPSSPAGQAARRASWRGVALRRFHRTIVVNEALREVFHRYGVSPEHCHLIPPYWVPAKAPALPPGALADFFARHPQVILSVGLLETEYDLPRQLEAFAALSNPSAGLLWIGSGSLEPQLRDLIAASPCRDRVLLLGDVPRPHTLAAIARAALLWRTTLYDGDAVSVREALHFGTPVLATDNGMRPPGVHLCPLANTAALVARTREVLLAPRPPRFPQDGEANLRAVLQLYQQLSEGKK